MKTITKMGSMLLIAALPISAKANQQRTEAKHEHQWTGTVTALDTQDKTLTGKHWLTTQTFHLGEKCAILTLDNKEVALGDLRPGEKVRIRYQNAEGVLVADRIAERALRYDGTVQTVDPKGGTMIMAEAPLYQPFRAPERFQIASDCKVILWNGHDGRLADVQPGDRISVVYELPNGSQVAYRIREKTSTFDGVTDTIDLSSRTLKARQGTSEKQFAIGDDCQVMLSGQRIGHLKDVMPGNEYRFTYEQVNGINVLDRIAPVEAGRTAQTASL